MNMLLKIAERANWDYTTDFSFEKLVIKSEAAKNSILDAFDSLVYNQEARYALIRDFFLSFKLENINRKVRLQDPTTPEELEEVKTILTMLQVPRSQLLVNIPAIIPIGLKVFKDKCKIPYNDWSRTKTTYLAMMSPGILVPYVRNPPEILKTYDYNKLVDIVLTHTTPLKKDPSLPAIRSILNDRLQGWTAWQLKIYTQQWYASPTKRTEDMILDPWDWSLMPPPISFTENKPIPKPTKQDEWLGFNSD